MHLESEVVRIDSVAAASRFREVRGRRRGMLVDNGDLEAGLAQGLGFGNGQPLFGLMRGLAIVPENEIDPVLFET
jgi:hypothetical protein